MTVDERHYDITLRDARLPLLRDYWFLAAVALFVSLLATSAWQHNIVSMVLSPFMFVLTAWWRGDLTRAGAWLRRGRARAGL